MFSLSTKINWNLTYKVKSKDTGLNIFWNNWMKLLYYWVWPNSINAIDFQIYISFLQPKRKKYKNCLQNKTNYLKLYYEIFQWRAMEKLWNNPMNFVIITIKLFSPSTRFVMGKNINSNMKETFSFYYST